MPSDSHDPHASRQSGDHSVSRRLSLAWNAAYRDGKYGAEPALGFTADIIRELEQDPSVMDGSGLYVGCGNGRNYVPLAKCGLKITGLDASKVALDALAKRLPGHSDLLVCGDFPDYDPGMQFQYVISIQAFQHGGRVQNQPILRKGVVVAKKGRPAVSAGECLQYCSVFRSPYH